MDFQDLKIEDYPSFLKLYNEAFPENERRLYDDEKHLADFIKMKGGKFHAFVAKDGNEFLGFLSYWNFEGYTYVEHFAVTPAKRGLNIGTKMLNHLIREVSPNVLLEVEPPTDSLTEKRIKFYERNGFRVRGEFRYTQPPYSPTQEPLEMLIMTHGDVSLHNSDSIKEMLREVYNVNHGA
jgi:ribosomal protein S18 acetylase RimI-like enzyme